MDDVMDDIDVPVQLNPLPSLNVPVGHAVILDEISQQSTWNCAFKKSADKQWNSLQYR